MTTESPTVRLDLESRPQAATIVRGMLAGVAELLTIDPELLDDLKTAVSEACNNVVLHAYGGDYGPMQVELFAGAERLRVVVEDEGSGLPLDATAGAEGIGLSVIRALADEVRLRPGSRGGLRLQMDFRAERADRTLFAPPAAAGPDHQSSGRRAGDEVVVSLSPVLLLPGVLGRLARTLAAAAHFSLDRFSDVYLVTDTLAAHAARAAAGSRIDARLTAADRRLELALGPFRTGAGQLLSSRQGSGQTPSTLELLSDEVSVEPDGAGDWLRVVVIDHRR